MEKKVDIRADLAKNRLYIVSSGFFQDDEIRQIAQKLRNETLKLKPGFASIVDIRNSKPVTQRGVEELEKVQIFSVQYGMKKAIRIVGDAVLARAQLDRMAKASGLETEFASSVEEAERMLDGQ